MKTYLRWVVCLGFVIGMFSTSLASSPSSANQKIVKDPKVVRKDRPPSISEILQGLRKQRSTTAKRIKRAQSALKKNQYKTLFSLVSHIKKEPLFSDYGYFLEAKANEKLGRSAYQKKAYSTAKSRFQKAIDSYSKVSVVRPESPLISKSKIGSGISGGFLGSSLYFLRSYRNSLVEFERAFERFDRTKLRIHFPQEHYEWFSKLCTKRKDPKCDNRVRWLIRSYPENSPERAMFFKYFPKSKDWEIDFPTAKRQFTRYYNSDKDVKEIEKGFEYFWKGRFGRSADVFLETYDQYPRTSERTRLQFWIGESLLRDHEEKSAEIFFRRAMRYSPLSFYALASSYRIKREPQVYFNATLPEAIDSDEHLTPKDQLHLLRAKKLYSEGVSDFAGLEASSIRLRPFYDNAFLVFLIGLAHQGGQHLRVFQIYSELIARDATSYMNNTFQLQATFPKDYYEDIVPIANQLEVDPILVLSLMKQESAFSKDIQSRSGASGLMQLMSFTALDVDPKINQSELTDAKKNIYLGTKYLKRVMRKFNGNWAMALAGYNAGPTRIKKWLNEKSEFKNLEEFIAYIPYKETKNYVRSIARNYYWYSYLIHGDRLNSLDRFFESKKESL